MLGPRVGPAWEIRASQPHELFTGTASSGSQAARGAEIAPSREAWLRWEEGGGQEGREEDCCKLGTAQRHRRPAGPSDAERGRCLQPREPPDPAMTPRSAPHSCNSLNTIEQLRRPGSGQVPTSQSSRCSPCPQGAQYPKHILSVGRAQSMADCLVHNPSPSPLLEVKIAAARYGGAPCLGKMVSGEDRGQTCSQSNQSPQNREKAAGAGGNWRSGVGKGLTREVSWKKKTPGPLWVFCFSFVHSSQRPRILKQ